jgi:undecaprenyl-diphosphatase
MSILQTVILALIQGLTEFLPVSSSAHLLLLPALTDWPDQGLAFDVALHLGSLGAVVLYFRRDIATLWFAWWRSLRTRALDTDATLAWAVLLGTIPVGLAGLALKDVIETELRSPLVVAATLIGFGVLLGWADLKRRGERELTAINWKDVLFIGVMQALALIPGTSRSGITMTAALMAGFNREAAARFSFLLSIPVTALASLLGAKDLVDNAAQVDWLAVGVGVVVSGISAYLCIHYFLAFIKRIGMQPFVAYRIALGLLLLVLYI